MTDTAVRKFSFDTVFEDNGRVIAPARPKKSFTPEEVFRRPLRAARISTL